MNYTSTVTSKGTITLPAAFRAKLALTEGDKVEISMRGSVVTIRPKLGWDEFFAESKSFGEKARRAIASGAKKPLLTNEDIAKVVEQERAKYRA